MEAGTFDSTLRIPNKNTDRFLIAIGADAVLLTYQRLAVRRYFLNALGFS